jgi:AraC-like DNA-binding protein
MIADPLLSLTQAFQLMGLIQCLVLIAYLIFCGGDRQRRLLAASFFIVLAADFGLPYWPEDWPFWVPAMLASIGAGVPALSYLLAEQMLGMSLPEKRQFAVLLLPLAGAYLVFSGADDPWQESCLVGYCFMDALSASLLWQVIVGGLVLLAIMMRVEMRLKDVLQKPQGQERKGLALGLVIVNLATLGVILASLFGYLTADELAFSRIALGLGFIYLATTMLFRVFPESNEFALLRHGAGGTAESPPDSAVAEDDSVRLSDDDAQLLERIELYLDQEKPHLKEDFHRGNLARALGVPEHRLSRVVNQGFGKSLIDVLNELRVAEAKRLLLATDQQITQIAFASGFNALPSFHRVFKKQAGCSPSEWREKGGKAGG